MDKADFVLFDSKGFHDAVDAISRDAEDGIDSPRYKVLDQNIGCVHVLLLESTFLYLQSRRHEVVRCKGRCGYAVSRFLLILSFTSL